MKVSVCITVFNEQESVGNLLDSLLSQKKKPDEIVIVDSESKDKTVEIIKHYQKKYGKIKLLVEKCSRSRGRNIAVEIARNEIIASTDAGCIPRRNWIYKLTEPFKNKNIDIVAGFYDMTGNEPIQKAFSVFLGISPNDFDTSFLPSTRSIAFRKSLWEKIGGFSENLQTTAEDMDFNFKAKDAYASYAFAFDARVEWGMPDNLKEGLLKMHNYAKGDAKANYFYHKSKGVMSHNIKIFSIFLRYLLFFLLIVFSFFSNLILFSLIFLLFLYIFWIYKKVYIKTDDHLSSLWGIIIQFSSDAAVMTGFIRGILSR